MHLIGLRNPIITAHDLQYICVTEVMDVYSNKHMKHTKYSAWQGAEPLGTFESLQSACCNRSLCTAINFYACRNLRTVKWICMAFDTEEF